jgi:hypothetical protein
MLIIVVLPLSLQIKLSLKSMEVQACSTRIQRNQSVEYALFISNALIVRTFLHMHPRRDFHFAREEEINVFVRFMIVLGYLKVMPFSPLIQMVLVTLEKMYQRTRGMRNSSIRCLKRYLL